MNEDRAALLRALQFNPFARHCVTDMSGVDITVASVHSREFDRLTNLVLSADSQRSIGVLLIGAPGVGKSHLLSRLFQWACEDHATVVYLQNLSASPERMFRHFLGAAMTDLTGRAVDTDSKLYRLLNQALVHSGFAQFKITRAMIESRQHAFTALCKKQRWSRNFARVLSAYLEGTSLAALTDSDADERAQFAIEWLVGTHLDDDELRALGLAPDAHVRDDADVCEVFRSLAQLCALARRPFVLCLDQVDSAPEASLSALAACAQTLLDSTKQMVVITCGVKESLQKSRGNGIAEQSWDRIAQCTLDLQKISPDQGRELVAARIERALSSVDSLAEVTEGKRLDPLYPLGAAWYASRVRSIPELRPRDVVLWARERWDEIANRLSGGPEVSPPQATFEHVVDEEIARKIADYMAHKPVLQWSDDNLGEMVSNVLHLAKPSFQLEGVRPPAKAPFSAWVHRSNGDASKRTMIGLRIAVSQSATSVTNALKQLAKDTSRIDRCLLVTRDLKKLGQVGQACLTELEEKGASKFRRICLTEDAHASLNAWITLLGSAKTGDLEIEHPRGAYRKLQPLEVFDSLVRQKLFTSHPIFSQLLEAQVASPERASNSAKGPNQHVEADDDLRERIMASLSWRTGFRASAIAKELRASQAIESQFTEPQLRDRIKCLAVQLAGEGRIFVTPDDDDIFLQMRKKKS